MLHLCFVICLFYLVIMAMVGKYTCVQYDFTCFIQIRVQRASLVAQLAKNPPAMQETWVHFLGGGDPLEMCNGIRVNNNNDNDIRVA